MHIDVKTALGGNDVRDMTWAAVAAAVGADKALWPCVRRVDNFCGEQLLKGSLGWKGILRELGFHVDKLDP